MAVTRIKNNQITDATVVANAKLVDYSVSSAKLANNLVYGSDFTVTGNLTVQGNTTTIDTTITTIEDPVIVLASTQTSGTPTVDIGFLGYRGNVSNIAFVWDESADEFVTAFTSTGETNTTITITSYANFHTNDANIGGNIVINGTTSLVGNVVGATSFTGNVTAGNLLTPGQVSVAGNLTGGNVNTGGAVSATGNVTGGNVNTAGAVSATGAITSAANISGANILTTGLISATGNITGGNVNTGGAVSATGNVTANFFIGNGSQLTGVTASSVDANLLTGNTLSSNVLFSSLTAVGTLTSLSVSGTTTTGNLETAGTVSATGNVIGGNIATAGLISATGIITSASDISGANISTGGLISATGTITGGNVLTGGLVSATGNITGGNLISANAVIGNINVSGNISVNSLTSNTIVSATGNITGGNLLTPGLISAAGLATSGNVQTAGFVSAAGNVTALAVNTATLASSGGITIATTGANGNISITPDGSGNIVLGGNTYINGVSLNPVQDNDVASKYYVDQLVATGLTYHQSVIVATTANLATTTGGTITYNQPNGAANGVGATITTTGSFTLIDSANVQTLGTRILVKNEGNAAFNGVYTWSNATVITRSTDTDEYGTNSAQQLSLNSYFFVSGGNINLGSAFVVDAPTGTITFGTSNIVFAQFSQAQVYSANTNAGLNLIGQTFSAKVDNDTTAFDGGGNIIVKAGANLTTPNIGAATATSLSSTGNISTGGNLIASGYVTATGNVAGGNITTAGLISATGNVAGNFFIGNGSQLTGVVASSANAETLTGTFLANNVVGSSLTSVGILTALSVSGTTTSGNLATGGTISATGTATVGNLATGGTVSATGNVTGGNILTDGLISATGNIAGGNLLYGSGIVSGTGNVYAANFIGNISGNIDAGGANTNIQFNDGDLLNGSAGFTFNKVGNVVTANGNILSGGIVSAVGNVFAVGIRNGGTGLQIDPGFPGFIQFSNGSGSTVLIGDGGNISAVGNVTGANILTGGLITAGGNITGANLILTSGIIDGPAAGRITINGSDIDTDFAVDGDTLANVFYVDAGTGTASFGSSTQVTNAIVNFATTTSIKTPVGNTSQRPATGVTGMLRFNTTDNNLEIYDNSEWTAVGVPAFTVIADEQFNGDGTTVAFTLSTSQTTNSCIVSINGVVQIPTSAYSVSGTTLTFTEAPLSGDLIDVRQITTTTSVTAISNSSGNAVIEASATAAQINVTGDLSVSGTILGGNINSTAITSGTSNMAIVSSGGNIRGNVAGTTVMTISPGLVDIQGNLTVSGNATLSGNILGDRIQNGTTIIDIQSPGGNANITIGGTANTAVFSSTALTLATPLLPSANITYDLGSTTQRWRDLWLSNSTIYLGNSQISANATALIFTNPAGGQTVLAGASAGITGATVSASGNVTGGNILTAGLISATGGITGAALTGTSLTVSTGNVSCGNIVNTNANGVGNIGSTGTRFNQVFALASSAQYADLAEKYTADADYTPGTVLVFGGAAEVTVDAQDADRRVAGVVSTNPAYIMNDTLEGTHIATVALTGRVPCLVTGTVRKGDLMVAAGLGRARAAADPRVGTVIGKALEDFDGADGTIEVVVGRF